jgi:hypothetical protein
LSLGLIVQLGVVLAIDRWVEMVDNEPDMSVAGTPLSIVGGWPGHSCSCRAAVAGLKPLSGAVAQSPVGL